MMRWPELLLAGLLSLPAHATAPGMVLPVAPDAPPGTIRALPDDVLALARTRWSQGDPAGTATLLEPWLASTARPRGRTKAAAHLLAGLAQLQLDNANLASAHFYQVRRSGGPLEEYGAWYEAVADHQRGRHAVAARECAAYRKSWPDGPYAGECLILMGDAYAATGRQGAASAAYSTYLEEHPDSPREEELKLARVQAIVKSQPEQAASMLIELALNHSYPSTDLAVRTMLSELAEAGIDIALPTDSRSLMRRCASLRRSGQFDASWALFEELVAMAPEHPEVAAWVSQVEDQYAWGNHRYDHYASRLLARYAVSPDPETAWKIYRAYARSGQWDKAAALGREAMVRHKGHWRWRSAGEQVARAELLSGDFAGAADRFAALSGGDARFLSAFAAYKAGLYDVAQARFDAVIRAGGHWQAAGYYWRGAVNAALGDPMAAAADRLEATRHDRSGWYWLLQQPLPTGGEWVQRDGRWHGDQPAALPQWEVPQVSPQAATGFWPAWFPIVSHNGKTRQGLQAPDAPEVDWSPLAWPVSPAAPAEWTAPIAQDAVPTPDTVGSLPDGYTACKWFDPDAAMTSLYRLAERTRSQWPELRTVYDLTLAGQSGEAARLLGPIYEQWRSQSSAPRLTTAQWRELFLVVHAHHYASRFCSGIGRGDADEDAQQAAMRLAYPMVRTPELFAYSQRFGLDPFLVMGIMRQESTYQEFVISHAGAIGLVQIMPRTGARVAALMGEHRYSPGDLEDPAVNIRYGTFYLSKLMERFGGAYPLAVASYNGGPHNVSRWMRQIRGELTLPEFVELIPWEETRDYVKRVSGHYAVYTRLYGPDGAALVVPLALDHDDASVIDF